MTALGSRSLLLWGLLVTLLACTHAAELREIGTWQVREDIVPHPEALHGVTVLLKQRNLARLEKVFWSVSDPVSPNYGKYLSIDEVTEIVAPPQGDVDKVISWLENNGAVSIDIARNRDAFRVTMPRRHVERIFNVNFKTFVAPNGKVIVRSRVLHSVPAEIAPHIDLILGVSDFPPVRRTSKPFVGPVPRRTLYSAGGAQSVPQIIKATSRGGNNISITFHPECLTEADGNYTCTRQVPNISYTEINVVTESQVIGKNSTYQFVSSNPYCSVVNGLATCTMSVEVDYFNAVNVSVVVYFGDGSHTAVAYYPFPVLSTPPILPQSIWAQYSIPPDTTVTHPNATQCVVEFEQQYYSSQDLYTFFASVGLPSDTPVYVIGPNDESNPGGEANLDIQYIMSVAPGSPTTFWSIAANSTIEIDDILAWALQIANTTNPPLVNSLSYGMTEGNVDIYLGKGYLARSDIEFQKLATRGLTIIIACGDAGAGDLGPPPMSAQSCNVLHADWPSQSPYVTAVGSTIITPVAEPICYLPPSEGGINCDNNPLGEIVVGMDQGLFWTTGGGFSNITRTAPYQSDFVEQYLFDYPNLLPHSGLYNPFGRAYPDVSTVGHNLMVVLNGVFIPVDGTSASAPIFAGVVSLLNDARLNAGKSPLGFLNPMLYKAKAIDPSTFYDVTVGTNRCGTIDFQPFCCPQGFVATPGWDAASGLGTPNFQRLKEYVLSLS